MKQFEQSAAKLRETAEALSRDPKLIDLCRHASRDRGLRARILSDPIELLRSREMDIPSELTIEFFEPPSRDLPISDWVHSFSSLPPVAPCGSESAMTAYRKSAHSDDAEWQGSVGDWNPRLSSDSPDHYARWTEVHPPDLIEIQSEGPSEPRVTVRAVALAARVGWFSNCEGVEFDIFPEASRPPKSRIKYEERRGPETYWPWGENSDNGSWITTFNDHVHVNARVCGGGFFGSPGRSKAIYRVWWGVDSPSPTPRPVPEHSPGRGQDRP